jgi:hypothetical protein
VLQHKLVRAIPLKFATIEHDTETHADGSCIFQITTPLISYVIQAKHKVMLMRLDSPLHWQGRCLGCKRERHSLTRHFLLLQVSMEEWISAIERNKAKPKLSTTEKITGVCCGHRRARFDQKSNQGLTTF